MRGNPPLFTKSSYFFPASTVGSLFSHGPSSHSPAINVRLFSLTKQYFTFRTAALSLPASHFVSPLIPFLCEQKKREGEGGAQKKSREQDRNRESGVTFKLQFASVICNRPNGPFYRNCFRILSSIACCTKKKRVSDRGEHTPRLVNKTDPDFERRGWKEETNKSGLREEIARQSRTRRPRKGRKPA